MERLQRMRSALRSWWRGDATDAGAAGRLRAQQAVKRAKRRAFWHRVYRFANGLFQINIGDFIAFLQTSAKWTFLGGSIGILAGVASAIFLISLAWATAVRVANVQLIFLLPLAGFLVGWIYERFGGTAVLGNNLVIDEVNQNRSEIPLRMAPLVLLGTVVTHLFGGSAGREGTAIQMGASMADGLRRLLHLGPDDRRLMIMAGISGGFGSVFGVPVAGMVFGMEVQTVGRIRYDGLIPCLVAAYIGDWVTRSLGAPHAHYPHMANLAIDPVLLLKVALAGLLFGLTSLLFIELTHGIKHLIRRITNWPPLYPVLGGAVVLGLTFLVGTTDYLGLSLPLIEDSLDGTGVVAFAFLLKLVFTAVTLGAGYLGGEVTPLFVIGSTLGYTIGGLLGVDPAFLAAIGLVAVFAGASNTPLACAIMGIELFGGGSPLYLFLGCVVAYLASGHRGIYTTQLISAPKALGVDVLAEESLTALAQRREGGWLPPLPGLASRLAQIPVATFMTPRATTIREDASLEELVTVALRVGVRTIPVVNGQKVVVGIVTDNDLHRSGLNFNVSLLKTMTAAERTLVRDELKTAQIRDIMSAPVVTVVQTATLLKAVQEMKTHHLKRLPVVDDEGRIAGMVTRSDILRQIVVADPMLPAGEDAPFAWHVNVGDIALQPVFTVPTTMPVSAVLQQMHTQGQKRAVVLDDSGKVAGMITTGDLLARAASTQRTGILAALQTGEAAGDMLAHPVSQMMTTPAITISSERKAIDALRLLIDHSIKRLPVINDDGEVIGLLGREGIWGGLFSNSGVSSQTPDQTDNKRRGW